MNASKLSISVGQFSDKGVKAENQDACGIRMPEDSALSNKGVAAVIADGVSSSAAGREASGSCVRGFLSDYYSTPDSWAVKSAGQRVLGALNRWLHGRGQSLFGSDYGMLTTLSALVVKSATAHLFHIGDTRIYLLRDGNLECLTRDHQTWVNSEKAFLSRALGADVNIEIDYRNLAVMPGDIFILTTDGVHGFINDQQLKSLTLQHQAHLDRAARAIVTHAMENNSRDNVTCQILRIEQLPFDSDNEFYNHLLELPFPPPLENGMIMDDYKILREIHASKRTQLYLASDLRTGEQVVIKTPSPNYQDDAEYIDRFRHEEWAGSRINCDHVLKIRKSDRPRRFLYYVTEYLPGVTLRQWMHDHPKPALSEVRDIIGQVAAGLRALHRLEMLHQDLKPENIMLDTQGTVKLVDFGSVKIAGIQEITTPLTHTHLLGTLDYAAPEYFAGYAGTNRSDLYSLGVICYEMLTGKLPYGGPLSRSKLKKVHYQPAPLINPKVPAWIDAAIEKAVHLNPKRRYNLLSEFTYDLEHPNTTLTKTEFVPLIDRSPVVRWRAIAVFFMILSALLLMTLVTIHLG